MTQPNTLVVILTQMAQIELNKVHLQKSERHEPEVQVMVTRSPPHTDTELDIF